MSVSVCCALLRVGGADLGGALELPASRERSVHKRTHAQSALFGCDHPGCGMFSSAPVEWRWRKRSEAVALASDHLASLQRFIGNLGSGTQQPVPRLRDRMLEQRAGTQAQNACPLCISCATRAIVVKIKRKNRPLLERMQNRVRVIHIR